MKSEIHLFINILSSIYYMPGPVLLRKADLIRRSDVPDFPELRNFLRGGTFTLKPGKCHAKQDESGTLDLKKC